MKHLARGPGIRLMMLALVTIVPALAFIVYDQAVERSRARAQAVDDAIGVARVAAAREAQVLDGVERLLRTLAHVPALRDNAAACKTLLGDVLRDHPDYINIWVTNADGSRFCEAVGVAPATTSAHRVWFERVMRTRSTATSDFQVSQTTGQPDVVVAQPLFAEDGTVERVLAAGVSVNELDNVVRTLGMPSDWSLTLADRNRVVIATYPHEPARIGQRLPDALSLMQAQHAPNNALITATRPDGSSRLYALAPMESAMDTGMYAAMEVNPASMFAKSNDLLRTNLWLLGIVAFVALGSGFAAARVFVLTPVETLTQVTSRIAAGDFGSRTQLARSAPGLRDLGTAIDQMAIALEARERTRAEVDERLQASERRYRLLFESNPHPMWVYDSETLQFLEVNDAAVELYGYTRDEFLSRRITDIRPPEEVAAVLASVARVREHVRYSGNWHHRLKSGQIIDVEVTSHAVQFNGRRARLVLSQDISERVRAERAVRDAEARVRFALEAARVGIWEARLEDQSSYWSETCELMHGLQPGTFGGTMNDVIGCVHPDDRQLVVDRFDEALRDRRTLDITYRTVASDGTERHVAAKGHFFYDDAGAPVRAAGVAIDITEQAVLEDQLRQSQKMEAIGQLAGGIAHDFNNVLTAILGNAEIYLDEAAETDPHRRTIEEIRTAGRAAANLTQQLLAFSRRQMLAPRVLRLGDSVSEVTPILRRLLGASVKLNTALSDSWCIKADPGQIQQVLINLAVNARDAMPQGGRLTIETCDVTLDDAYVRRHPTVRPGAYVLITVSDNGHGMNAATQRRLFEPFFTTKQKGQGTGLGLATVHGIVRQSDGHITVESEVGAGSTFRVYLPKTEAAEAEAVAAHDDPGSLIGAETILLVEDEASVRDFAYRVLTRYGYRVYALPDPQHAIEFAAAYAGTLDMIVTDVVLPEINGQVLAGRLRALHPATRVLYISGYTDISVITGSEVEAGASLLKKPFTAEALGKRVRTILDAQIA